MVAPSGRLHRRRRGNLSSGRAEVAATERYNPDAEEQRRVSGIWVRLRSQRLS